MVLDCASAEEGKTIVPAASANAPAIIISAVRIAFMENLQQPHPRAIVTRRLGKVTTSPR